MKIRTILALLLLAAFAIRPARAQEPAAAVINRIITVNVLGAVQKPSRFELPAGATIFDAIASAGGATQLGNLSKVKLIHKTTAEKQAVVTVNVKQMLNGTTEHTVLRDGDTLYLTLRI